MGMGMTWTRMDNRQQKTDKTQDTFLTINLFEKILNIWMWMCIRSRSDLVFHQTGDGGYRTFEIKFKFSCDSNVAVLFVVI